MVRDYSAWIKGARDAGMTEERITSQLEAWMREDLKLLEGKCPKCDAPVRRIVEGSKRGAPEEEPGSWVLYRCSRDKPPGQYDRNRPCGYMLDRWERTAAN